MECGVLCHLITKRGFGTGEAFRNTVPSFPTTTCSPSAGHLQRDSDRCADKRDANRKPWRAAGEPTRLFILTRTLLQTLAGSSPPLPCNARTCAHTDTPVCTHTHNHSYTHADMCTHTPMCTHRHTTGLHSHMHHHVHTQTCMYRHTAGVHSHTYHHTHTQPLTYTPQVCTHTTTHIHTQTCAHTQTHHRSSPLSTQSFPGSTAFNSDSWASPGSQAPA